MSNMNFKQHPLTFQGDQAAQTPLKGNKWVLRFKLWVRALKTAQNWDFWDLHDVTALKKKLRSVV